MLKFFSVFNMVVGHFSPLIVGALGVFLCENSTPPFFSVVNLCCFLQGAAVSGVSQAGY